MSSTQNLEGAERRGSDDDKDKKNDGQGNENNNNKANTEGDAEMQDVQPENDEILDEEILSLSTQDLQTRKRLLENDARIMKSEFQRLSHEKATMGEKIKENMEKIANNRYALPYPGSCWISFGANGALDNYHTSLATLSSS
jgi:26S proteasome regulatory subunit T5